MQEIKVFVSCFSPNDLNDSGQNKEKQCLHCPNSVPSVELAHSHSCSWGTQRQVPKTEQKSQILCPFLAPAAELARRLVGWTKHKPVILVHVLTWEL